MPQQGFWSDINTEPMRQFRFLLSIGGIPQWVIKKVNKPTYELGESEHQYINHTFYYPTRLKWNPVTVTLVDPVTPHASRTMINILQSAGYHYPLNSNDTSSISKKNAVNSLGLVTIEQIDADSNIIERWVLNNAWIKSVKFGDLAYDSDNMVEVELTLRFDYAEMEIPGYDAGLPPANA